MIETSRDWNIRKKLDETRRVYVMPARANDKTYTQLELYSELMAQGKKVQMIRLEDIQNAIKILKQDPILDPAYEIWTRRDSELHKYLDERYEDYLSEGFEPTVKPYIWAYDEDTPFRKEQAHWLMNRYGVHDQVLLPNIYVIDKSKLD